MDCIITSGELLNKVITHNLFDGFRVGVTEKAIDELLNKTQASIKAIESSGCGLAVKLNSTKDKLLKVIDNANFIIIED